MLVKDPKWTTMNTHKIGVGETAPYFWRPCICPESFGYKESDERALAVDFRQGTYSL